MGSYGTWLGINSGDIGDTSNYDGASDTVAEFDSSVMGYVSDPTYGTLYTTGSISIRNTYSGTFGSGLNLTSDGFIVFSGSLIINGGSYSSTNAIYTEGTIIISSGVFGPNVYGNPGNATVIKGGKFEGGISGNVSYGPIEGVLDVTGTVNDSFTISAGGTIVQGIFTGTITNHGTITGGTYASATINTDGVIINNVDSPDLTNSTINFIINNVSIAGINISGAAVTANGVTVTDGGSNTIVGTTFTRINNGHFHGFIFGNGTWTGTNGNWLNDPANWTPLIPVDEPIYTATIPDGVIGWGYPNTGTAVCSVNVGLLGSDKTASLLGGTYSGEIISYGTLGGNIVCSGNVDNFGDINSGTFNKQLTLEAGSNTSNPTSTTSISGTVIYKAGAIIDPLVSFANIKGMTFCDSPIFTKGGGGGGINGSGILGMI